MAKAVKKKAAAPGAAGKAVKKKLKEGVLKGKIGDLPELPEAAKQDAPAPSGKGRAQTRQASEFFWQEPGSRDFLANLAQKRLARRAKLRVGSVEKDGVTLAWADGSGAKARGGNQAEAFLTEELFQKRKRKRSVKDLFDRVGGGHRLQEGEEQGKGKRGGGKGKGRGKGREPGKK